MKPLQRNIVFQLYPIYMKIIKSIFFLSCLLLSTIQARPQSPGGVSSGLAVWLKADAGTSSAVDGAYLSSWQDQSGNNKHATQSTGPAQPRFRKGILNGNSAIETTSGTRFFNIDFSGISNSNFTIITVVQRTNAMTSQYVCGVQQASPVGMHLGWVNDNTCRFGQGSSTINKSSTAFSSGSETPRVLIAESSSTAGRTISEYLNGVLSSSTDASASNFSISANTGAIGRGYTTSGFSGYIGEVIVYNRVLTNTERQQILTYLSIKYGHSLADSDHLYFSGSGYDNDLVGIGVSTSQGLSKISSRSANSDGMIELSSTNLTNGTYVVVGNNNGSNAFSTAGAAGNCGITNLLGRRWKATVTGSVSTVDLKFALNGLTYNANDICLVVDPEANGFSDEAPISGVISNDSIQFSSVRLTNGALFTLAEGTHKYYAVTSGLASGAIWAVTPNGTGGAISLSCGKAALVINPGVNVVADNSVYCNGLDIRPGASFAQGNFLLSSTGDVNADGTLTATSGAANLTLNGKFPQQLRGTQQIQVQGLTISNANGVSINSPGVNAHKVVQINSGTLTTNGKLTLISDATSTGSIGPLTTGDITGNVTIQRRHVATSTGWLNLCAPAQNKTINDWNDDLVTTGFFGSDYPAVMFNSIQYYLEFVAGGINAGFAGVGSVNESIVDGQGYFVYVSAGTYNIDVDGAIFKGNQTIPVTYTNTSNPSADGRNLVANPYPSAINWDATGWTKTNMNNAVYVWNAALGQYASYINGVSTYGGSPIIPSSQAFYVIANAASPQLIATEAVKTSTEGTFKSSVDVARIQLTNGIFEDETILVFDDRDDAVFDGQRDALKMRSPLNTVPVLATVDAQGNEYAINRINTQNDQEIYVIAFSQQGGVYALNFEGLGTGWELYDLVTGATQSIGVKPIHVDLTLSKSDEPRFVMRRSEALNAQIEEDVIANYQDGTLTLFGNFHDEEKYQVSIYNASGQLVDSITRVASMNKLSTTTAVAKGVYFVQIVNNKNEIVGTKFIY